MEYGPCEPETTWHVISMSSCPVMKTRMSPGGRDKCICKTCLTALSRSLRTVTWSGMSQQEFRPGMVKEGALPKIRKLVPRVRTRAVVENICYFSASLSQMLQSTSDPAFGTRLWSDISIPTRISMPGGLTLPSTNPSSNISTERTFMGFIQNDYAVSVEVPFVRDSRRSTPSSYLVVSTPSLNKGRKN